MDTNGKIAPWCSQEEILGKAGASFQEGKEGPLRCEPSTYIRGKDGSFGEGLLSEREWGTDHLLEADLRKKRREKRGESINNRGGETLRGSGVGKGEGEEIVITKPELLLGRREAEPKVHAKGRSSHRKGNVGSLDLQSNPLQMSMRPNWSAGGERKIKLASGQPLQQPGRSGGSERDSWSCRR